MAFTGYFKTQKIPGTRNNHWTVIDTSINQIPSLLLKGTSSSMHYFREAPLDTNLYLHDASPTEPVADGSLNETDFTGESEVIYSGSGYLKSFTTETSFFTANQNLNLGTEWKIWYNAYANVDDGYVGFIIFEFYKRNASNTDTLLFSHKVYVSAFASVTGYTTTATASGSVATTDRLRVRISMGQEAI